MKNKMTNNFISLTHSILINKRFYLPKTNSIKAPV
jgi:hypothetical protein